MDVLKGCIVWVWVDSGVSLFYEADSNSYGGSDHWGGLEVMPDEGVSEVGDVGVFGC